jgi:hypothetical protein
MPKNIKPSEVIFEQLRELMTAQHDFKTVVIDTVTALNALFEAEVVEFDDKGVSNIGEAAGGYNKGYLVVAGIHAKLRVLVSIYASAALVSCFWHTLALSK